MKLLSSSNSCKWSNLKASCFVYYLPSSFLNLIFVLQPAAEIIAFRFGELKGLSRWRARYNSIGLDEKLTDDATEKAGMLLVQVERFLRVLAGVSYQVGFRFFIFFFFS